MPMFLFHKKVKGQGYGLHLRQMIINEFQNVSVIDFALLHQKKFKDFHVYGYGGHLNHVTTIDGASIKMDHILDWRPT